MVLYKASFNTVRKQCKEVSFALFRTSYRIQYRFYSVSMNYSEITTFPPSQLYGVEWYHVEPFLNMTYRAPIDSHLVQPFL